MKLIHKGTQTIKTERLILRRFTIDDTTGMFNNWATDSFTTKYLSWDIYSSIEELKIFIEKIINKYENIENYNWVIEFNGDVVGNISIHDLSNNCSRCELGYCLGSKFWNIGIMSEAVSAVIKFLFNDVGMNRVVAKHDTQNIASGRVMQKNGMVLEGILRQHSYRKDDTYGDYALYGILKEDWENNV